MDFSTNWLVMKSIQTLENEIDPRPAFAHVVDRFLGQKVCQRVHPSVRIVHLLHRLQREGGGDPGVRLVFVNVCLRFGAAATVNNYKNWV